MKRREFIYLVSGAMAWAHAARGQQAVSVRRIGLLSPFFPNDASDWNKALLRGLRDAGWIDGRNLAIEYRYAEGKKERLPELVTDLIRQKVDIIVTTVTVDTLAAKNATAEIPIVMVAVRIACLRHFTYGNFRPLAAFSHMA
jgi:putative tryptophan/tyrosine transport system substrate-binding protein